MIQSNSVHCSIIHARMIASIKSLKHGGSWKACAIHDRNTIDHWKRRRWRQRMQNQQKIYSIGYLCCIARMRTPLLTAWRWALHLASCVHARQRISLVGNLCRASHARSSSGIVQSVRASNASKPACRERWFGARSLTLSLSSSLSIPRKATPLTS